MALASSISLKLHLLMALGIIHDRHMFIVQATVINDIKLIFLSLKNKLVCFETGKHLKSNLIFEARIGDYP